MISIHALLTESDFLGCSTSSSRWISIHALLTESDVIEPWDDARVNPFQSTLSSRRATRACGALFAVLPDFNPRSPHGERQITVRHLLPPAGISIHALLTESDVSLAAIITTYNYFNPRSPHGERLFHMRSYKRQCNDFNPRSPHGERLPMMFRRASQLSLFQSTLSSRRATVILLASSLPGNAISIHALLTESDTG